MTDIAQARLRRGRLAILLLLGFAVLLGLSRVATQFYVDVLWHRQTGYLPVFLRSLAWVWGLRAIMTLLVSVLLYLNLRVVASRLGALHIRRKFGNLEIAEQVPKQWITGAVVGFSVLMGLWFGGVVPEGVSRSVLLWLSAGEWGMVDPYLGRDLSYFVFTVPVLQAGLAYLLILAFLVLTVVVAGYAATGGLQLGPNGVKIEETARKHLGALMAVFLLLIAARSALARAMLLQGGNSDVQGIFGFTDAQARLPALRIQATLFVMAAVGLVWGAWKNRALPALASVIAVLVGSTVVAQLYPNFVQRFQVVPNELARETPYIDQALRFTRMGFGLDEMERRLFEARAEGQVDWDDARAQFAGLPVWSSDALLTTFREVDARFRYYDFRNVAFDRYPGPNGPVPVAVSVREVDPLGIEDPNWQNLHIRERYIVGNGVVAIPATEKTPQGRPQTYLSGIPVEMDPAAPPSLQLDRSRIFFGNQAQQYALVNASDSAYTAPDGGIGAAGVDFPAGITVGGFFKKLLLAWNLQEANLLFAGEVEPNSRLILRRGVIERVQAIAPFLRFPEAAYPVVDGGRVVWVLEGYTASSYFPLSQPFRLEATRPGIAYARNSVKVTVDAVTGAVDFYRVPVEDPLLEAWSQAFPELLKPLSEMPASLQTHLRYGQGMIALQAEVLLQYHQDEAPVFFGQQDVWARPQELAQSTNPVQYRPEFGLYRMPGDTEPTFQLTTAFVPAGRQNLTGILAGRLREDGSPELRLFDVPIEEQIAGPRQVEALVEQDPAISQQFSLWRTGGSRVWTGHLHLVPVGDRLVYMEPVFLAAEEDAIPELRRFVVSDGRRVAMEETLLGAIQALAAGDGGSVGAIGPSPVDAGASANLGLPGIDPSRWPAEALDMLEEAEARLRAGDFAGFGERLDRLRTLLRSLSSGEGG